MNGKHAKRISHYRPHYTGKRRIAAERNRRKIQSGKIPRDQVLMDQPTLRYSVVGDPNNWNPEKGEGNA